MGSTTLLHEGESVVLSRWHCPPSSPRWRGASCTGDRRFLIALAHRPVGIRHEGGRGLWADQGGAVLYDPQQVYERRLLHPDGDVADILGFAPSLVEEAIGRSFGAAAVPLPDATFLLQRKAFHSAEPLALEEAATLVLADVAAQLGRPAASDRTGIVDRTRRLLAADLGERISLAELARRAHVSPFHLARVFKAATGSTLHDFREGLRLRVAADRALAGDRLADVAADLGFASHSHLTARFRRRFGVPPGSLT